MQDTKEFTVTITASRKVTFCAGSAEEAVDTARERFTAGDREFSIDQSCPAHFSAAETVRNEWEGPSLNPMAIVYSVAAKRGLTKELQNKLLEIFAWVDFDEKNVLDDVLAEIAGGVHIVVKKESDGWYAKYDGPEEKRQPQGRIMLEEGDLEPLSAEEKRQLDHVSNRKS